MVPPRLTLVSDNTRDNDGERPEDAEAGAGTAQYSYGDPEAAVDHLAEQAKREKMRRIEALLFASREPLDEKALAIAVEPGDDVAAMLADLQADYARRGVNLVHVAGKWQFRPSDDLSFLLERQQKEERRLSKAALETLAIIAYHQPVTRAEIEEIRGVSTSPGTLDVLMECEWIRPRGRRRAPGRPLTFGTTETFLAHFGLASIKDLPGLADLKSSGLLDANLPPDFKVPEPTDVAALMPDELPLTDDGVEDETEDGQQDELPLHDEDGTANPDQGGAEAPPETEGA